METVGLFVSIPIASFRVPRAREYFETFPIPPPATVYGMLLSMIGEMDRRALEGAELAIALLSEPEYSVVLRTLWRVKKRDSGLGLGENRRPDFQELLTNVRLAVWVRDDRSMEKSLASRVRDAVQMPACLKRFGGLCLGESTHLVDEVKLLDDSSISRANLLFKDEMGEWSLPVWVDHVGSDTTWAQYSILDVELNTMSALPDRAWTRITRDSGLAHA